MYASWVNTLENGQTHKMFVSKIDYRKICSESVAILDNEYSYISTLLSQSLVSHWS